MGPQRTLLHMRFFGREDDGMQPHSVVRVVAGAGASGSVWLLLLTLACKWQSGTAVAHAVFWLSICLTCCRSDGSAAAAGVVAHLLLLVLLVFPLLLEGLLDLFLTRLRLG